MGRLAGQVALITGASKGLGQADARLFVAEGARVVVADIDSENGERLAGELGAAARFQPLDVTSEDAVRNAIATIIATEGRLNVLVNNAGIVIAGDPETLDAADYRQVLAVSLDGTVFACKHALSAMRASGGGSIVNVSSVSSIQGSAYAAAYAAAKGAVEAYTRAVAVHCKLNAYPIRCNSIHPGIFDTPMLHAMAKTMRESATDPSSDQFRKRATATLGDPIDVAWLALFLASDESRYINGQRFVIDNGDSITPRGV